MKKYGIPKKFESVICLLFLTMDNVSLYIGDGKKHNLYIQDTQQNKQISLVKLGIENLYKQVFAIKELLRQFVPLTNFDSLFQEIDSRLERLILQRLAKEFEEVDLEEQGVAFTKAFPPNGNQTSWQSYLDWRDNQLKKIQTFPETPLFDDMTSGVTPTTSDNILKALISYTHSLKLSRRCIKNLTA